MYQIIVDYARLVSREVGWESGKTQAWLAETYAVSMSRVWRYIQRVGETGSVAAWVRRRQQSRISKESEPALCALVVTEPDARPDEYCATWERQTGIVVSIQTMSRMPVQLGLRQKKTIGRQSTMKQQRRLASGSETLPARRVVVIDECSTCLDMTPRYARAEWGQCAYAHARRNTGKNVILLAGLRLDGMDVAMIVEGAVDTPAFEAYVRHTLLPVLHPGDLVVLDNHAVRKSATVRALLHSRGVRLLFLHPYSPDVSPIENAFAKLK
jgi:transposase